MLGDPFGAHRVLEPRGVLPQPAWKLDAVHCSTLKVGAPQVSLAALSDLHRLLITCESRLISADGNTATLTQKVTRKGSERIVRYAFDLARSAGRKKVTIVHKANILKSTSGLFLKVAREVSARYPDIEHNEMIVDNTCMQLVLNPWQFDVLVTTNLFGDIISDLCAGLVGGLGLAPGANIGENVAIFEAVHGSAPDIAGKGIANPCALLLAAGQMLDHLGMPEQATRLRNAIVATLEAKDTLTPDLGGTGSTTTFAEAIIRHL